MITEMFEIIRRDVRSNGIRKSILPSVTVTLNKTGPNRETGYLSQYAFMSVFGTEHACEEEDIDRVKEIVIQKLKHELYGQLKQELIDLTLLLYSRDFYKCRDRLFDIIKMIEEA